MDRFQNFKKTVAMLLAILTFLSGFSIVVASAAETSSAETGANVQIIGTGATMDYVPLGASGNTKYNVYGNHNYDVYWNKTLNYTNAVTGDKETFYANQYLNFHQVAPVGSSTKTTTWCIEPYFSIKNDGKYGKCGSGGNSEYWNKFKAKSNIYNASCETLAYARAHSATSNGAYYFAAQLLIYEYVMNIRYASLGNNFKIKDGKSSLIGYIKSKNKDKIKDAYDNILSEMRTEKNLPPAFYNSVGSAKKVIKKTAIFLTDKKNGSYTYSGTKTISGLKDYNLTYKIVNQNDGGAVDSKNMTLTRDGNKITVKSNYDLKKREDAGYTYYIKVTKKLNYSSASSSIAYQNSNKNSQTLLGDVKYSESVVGYYPIYYRYTEKLGDITVKKTVEKSADSPEGYKGSLSGWTFLLTNKAKTSEQYLLTTDSSGECDTLEDFALNTTFIVTELGFKITADEDMDDYHYVQKYNGVNYGFPLEWESKTGSKGTYGFFETTATVTSTTTVKKVTWKNEYTKPFELRVVKNVDDDTSVKGYYFLVYSPQIFGKNKFARILGPTDANGKITEKISGYDPNKNDDYCIKELGLVKNGVTEATVNAVADYFEDYSKIKSTTDINNNLNKLDAVFYIPDRYDVNNGTYELSGVKGADMHSLSSKHVNQYYAECEVDNTTSGFISVNKHDSHDDKPVGGAVYGVYSMNGQSTDLVFDESTEVCRITTDEKGYGISKKIPTGNYYVKEISSPSTYYLDEKAYPVTVKPGTNTEAHPNVYNQDLKDKPTEIEVNKKIASTLDDNGKQLAGAKLELYTAYEEGAGEKIYSFTSSDKPEMIYGLLEVGKKYRLHEVSAPKGYCVAEDIIFTVNEKAEKTVVDMDDKTTKIKFHKQDSSTENNVTGAELQLKDKDGNIVEVPVDNKMVKSWITTEEPLSVEGVLPLGETFTLYEIKTPKGFATADPVTFTVAADGGVQSVVMYDAPLKVSVTKTDITGEKELEGAHLKITDSDDEIIESWISDGKPHLITYSFIAGEAYTLTEEVPCKGYVTAESITFTVADTGEVQHVQMKDEVTKIALAKVDKNTKKCISGAVLQLTDKDGNIVQVPGSDGNLVDSWTSTDEPFSVEGILVVGETYKLSELSPPDGYSSTEPVTFTVEDTPKVQTITMEDDTIKFEFTKTDITGEKEVVGARLQVMRVVDNNKVGDVVESWVSTDKPHRIDGKLIAGGKYLLRETIPADGYATANDIVFDVTDTGEVQKVEMKDDTIKVRITKYDITGDNELEGAKMQIKTTDGKIIAKWTSTKESYYLEGVLVAGKTYVLHEEVAPDGYVVANDVKFTVLDTGKVQSVSMKDDTTKVEFRKKASDTGKLLAGAKFVLYDSKGDKVTSWTSTNKAYRIDASLKVGAKYTWHEVSAPSGYKKAEDVTFTVNKYGKVQAVEMIDEKIVTPDLPKTGGTSSNPAPLIAIGITMMIAGAFVFFRVKTREI